ncbi:MAG TPA: EscU/YscU/HrcU family type III secretion system export apparatus switch protein [Kofleriaceae bacterium]
MADDRAFPPSPRRLALARRAGLHAASPVLVGALACGGIVLALVTLGRAVGARVGDWIAAACDLGGTRPALAPRDAAGAIIELALPLVIAAALAAVVAQLAQTRAVWLPRRRLDNAPALDRGAGARTRRTAFELVSAAIIAGVAIGWLWWVAPRLARLPSVPLAGASLLASFLAAIAIAWVAIGVVDALLRAAELARALRMTARERREDERLGGADPRWRSARAAAQRTTDPRAAMAGSTLLVLGDDLAVAIAWDPIRRPTPVRTATGRRARATQLVGLARQQRIPIHRDVALAAALVASEGPIPEPHWPRLAEIVAALR